MLITAVIGTPSGYGSGGSGETRVIEALDEPLLTISSEEILKSIQILTGLVETLTEKIDSLESLVQKCGCQTIPKNETIVSPTTTVSVPASSKQMEPDNTVVISIDHLNLENLKNDTKTDSGRTGQFPGDIDASGLDDVNDDNEADDNDVEDDISKNEEIFEPSVATAKTETDLTKATTQDDFGNATLDKCLSWDRDYEIYMDDPALTKRECDALKRVMSKG